MPQLWQFVGLLAVHWLGDFVLQTHCQSQNKSKRVDALLRHVATYTAVLLAGSIVLFGAKSSVLWFVAINGALHFGVDFVTSRITSRLYARERWHDFFVVVGFDQLIYQVTLAGTLVWLLGVS
jgi:hypothetical protein